jgi:hypothetical protein
MTSYSPQAFQRSAIQSAMGSMHRVRFTCIHDKHGMRALALCLHFAHDIIRRLHHTRQHDLIIGVCHARNFQNQDPWTS